MSRALACAIALVVPLVLAAACTGKASARRTNVVLVTVDTLRADHLGCYGYPRSTTPRADELALAGIRFSQAVVPIPETLPSLASIFTGTYPIDHGVRRNDYELLTLPTLAELLASAGWRTAGFGSSAVVEPGTGIERGFELYDATLPHRFLRMENGQRRAEATTDAALDWLERQVSGGRRERLFLWVHYIDPHGLYDAPEPFGSRFTDPEYAGSITGDVEQFFRIVQKELPLDPADRRFMIDRYDGEIAFADFHFGRLIDALSDLELADTLVVYTADHGESLGEHGYLFDHGDYLYEDQIRVPLIFRHPDVPAGRVVDRQVEVVDVLPTVLDFVGLDPPENIRGTSLATWFAPDASPGGADHRDHAYSESAYCEQFSLRPCWPYGSAGKLVAMRHERWKLIYDPRGRSELYDLEADPGETADLTSRHPEIARRLAERLAEVLASGTAGEDQQLDPETIEKLRALGYAR